MDRIKHITQEDANIILNLYNEGKAYLCEGLFLFRSNKHIWTAIDNSSGDCFTEDFKSKEKAEEWLLI